MTMTMGEFEGFITTHNKDKNIVTIRTNKFGSLTGGHVLITIARFRNFKDAIRKHKDYVQDMKKFLTIPTFITEFMADWKRNDITITFGQNGTTQWNTGEFDDIIYLIEDAKIIIYDTEISKQKNKNVYIEV